MRKFQITSPNFNIYGQIWYQHDHLLKREPHKNYILNIMSIGGTKKYKPSFSTMTSNSIYHAIIMHCICKQNSDTN